MRILILPPSRNKSLALQARILQVELGKCGQLVEVAPNGWNWRVARHHYDVIHFLRGSAYSLRDCAALLHAHLRGIKIVVSDYRDAFSPGDVLEKVYAPLLSAAVAGFSATSLSNLKKNKSYKKNKFILPFLPGLREESPASKTLSEERIRNVINLVPVESTFESLNQLNSLDPRYPVYVDGTGIVGEQFNHSTARRKWAAFLAANPDKKNFTLILSALTMKKIFRQNVSVLQVAHLQKISYFYDQLHRADLRQCFLVLNENQASGYAHLWHHKKNCWLVSKHHPFTSFALGESLAYFIRTNEKKEVLRLNVEKKVNELSRIYAKLLTLPVQKKLMPSKGEETRP